MSTLNQLLALMKGRSLTHEWDAIVVYSRAKANAMLLEQTIERLQKVNEHIAPINGEVIDEGTVTTRTRLIGLQLGVPVLSFEGAQRRSQSATLRFGIDGGMVVTSVSGAGISERVTRLEQVLPSIGATLTLHLDLHPSGGGVSSVGDVYIDLSEGTDISCSLGERLPATQRALAEFFTRRFKDIPNNLRKYTLGTLGSASVPALTPQRFAVRVVSHDALPGAKHSGDGAIELYIQFIGGQPGNTPGPDFPCLIPDDPGKDFSASLLLSSRVLFDKVLKPQLIADIGRGIAFADFKGGSGQAWVLEASAGVFSAPFVYHYRSAGFDAEFSSPMETRFGPEGGQPPFTFKGDGEQLQLTWRKTSSTRFRRWLEGGWPFPDDVANGDLHFSQDFQLNYRVALGSNGVVEFKRDPEAQFALQMTGHEYLPDLGGGHLSKINEVAVAHFKPPLVAFLQQLTPPAIDTFVARNLLFPGRNAFVPSEVRLPGDLFLAGRLDHVFEVLPAQAFIGGGAVQVFSTRPAQSGVTWSIAGVRGETAGLGSIGRNTGHYQAPASDTLPLGFRTVVVTASAGGISASTLINVVRETVAVNPLFQVCDAGESRSVSAFGLGPGTLVATLETPGNGGALVSTGTDTWSYTAAARDPAEYFVLDSIIFRNTTTGASKKASVLVIHDLLSLRIELDEETPGQGGQLRAFVGDKEVPASEVEWGLIGSGHIDAAGRYVPPTHGVAGFDLVTGLADRNAFIPPSGYRLIVHAEAYPRGLQARRDLFGTIYVSWDAIPGAVEYEVEGFERKVTTRALKCLLLLATMGIANITLKGRYADGQWSQAIVLRFRNMAG